MAVDLARLSNGMVLYAGAT
ncbi:MAG: hypothetical protein CISAcid_15740 [uncultured Acidilobus sp. CIS]|jgi:hypothetical protein|nr:MAG: hypothetical protein CISAcid_15740 [uncultured Acidilobus sp. CIS]